MTMGKKLMLSVNLRALKSALAKPKPKTASVATVTPGGKSGRGEFPLEDSFGEM
jgi:hypothetical protein